MPRNAQRFWIAYSTILTTVVALLTMGRAVGRPSRASFEEIDVQRINVREPDGTLRMTIAGTARAPGMIVRGKERPHPSGR
jgi:hypothetical protein